FEQLKKEQAKKGKKAGTKKRDDKTAPSEPKADDGATASEEPAPSGEVNDSAPIADENPVNGDDDAAAPLPQRQPSLSDRSRQRSKSFRQGAPSPIATDRRGAGLGPLSPGAEVQDLYNKQAARIEELERENAAYQLQQEDGAARLAKVEEELEGLREGSSDVAELRSKSKDAEKMGSELAAVQRQLAQAQQAAKGAGANRRMSGASNDVGHELA
ncbi:hypothetical protein LTR53_018416, partial [Teratosphaeriaceae sp. CCFEE 6253]